MCGRSLFFFLRKPHLSSYRTFLEKYARNPTIIFEKSIGHRVVRHAVVFYASILGGFFSSRKRLVFPVLACAIWRTLPPMYACASGALAGA